MTNALALYFGAAIAIALGADMVLFDWHYTIFWLKKLVELIDYIAIWR